MDKKEIIESLSPIERAILPNIRQDFIDLEEIAKKSSQDFTTAYRAASFLKNKGLIEIKEETEQIADLGVLGINYLRKKLPERRLLDILSEKKIVSISDIRNLANLNENEEKVAIGTLKKKALIELKHGKIHLNAKMEEISKKTFEELLLEKLPAKIESLEPQEKYALENLKSRKDIIQIINKKKIYLRTTKEGEEIKKEKIEDELIESLTPKIIKQGTWRTKKFRRYDLTTQAPKIYGGKRHFVNQATEYAKSIWIEMGFKEMTGDMILPGFWNFDALFTAQDHPVREEQDTFYLKNLKAKIKSKEVIENVKKAHEGKIPSSKGWQQEWNEEESKKVVLRTHTTPLSIKTLHKIKEKNEIPSKYFAIGKCFRNETVDWSHGFEFNQTEGIVIDFNANFRHLLGYLKEFFRKMGYERIRIRPGYFPYTEPSLEIEVFHPKRKCFVELGGAGMFRPEVTIPIFGEHIPVLAWGPGFDRIIMEYFKITDLREMYKNDINTLREMKFWAK